MSMLAAFLVAPATAAKKHMVISICCTLTNFAIR